MAQGAEIDRLTISERPSLILAFRTTGTVPPRSPVASVLTGALNSNHLIPQNSGVEPFMVENGKALSNQGSPENWRCISCGAVTGDGP